MGLHQELVLVLKNRSYANAVITVMKNILVDREALYAIEEWVNSHRPALGKELSPINDDRIGRALDQLHESDRATLQTRIVLKVMKALSLKMAPNAAQLKRGHNKDHRPDLKQLIYNLCVTSDGAVPVKLRGTEEQSLRTLLQKPDFIYVADSKFCVEDTMRSVDKEARAFCDHGTEDPVRSSRSLFHKATIVTVDVKGSGSQRLGPPPPFNF